MKRFALFLALLLAPACAHAQPDEARTAEARVHFTQGTTLFEADDYAAALREFETAYDLMDGHPNRGMVLLNTARCHDRLRQYPEALEDYRQFLIEAPDDSPNREDARTRVEELEPVVAAGADAAEPDPPDDSGDAGGESRSEGSIANWLIAGGLVAAAIPAIAIPSWTLSTEGECVDMDSLGCRERVQFGATDGVLFGLAGLGLAGALVFAIAQPIQVEVHVDAQTAYVGVRGAF